MQRSVRTVLVMVLAPPLLIYSLAFARVLLTTAPEWVIWTAMIAVWAVGMTALLTSKWRQRVIVGVGVAYTFASILVLPLFTLSASCMVGPCL